MFVLDCTSSFKPFHIYKNIGLGEEKALEKCTGSGSNPSKDGPAQNNKAYLLVLSFARSSMILGTRLGTLAGISYVFGISGSFQDGRLYCINLLPKQVSKYENLQTW